MNTEIYAGTSPALNLSEYFNGEIDAWGLIQDRRRRVITRFKAHMVCSWQGDNGELKEKFDFYDGKTQQRVWSIKKLGGNQFEGRAHDIIDKAQGETNGIASLWKYRMDVPVDDKTFRLTFEDWMWRIDDDVVINRSYMRKFGIIVAELTLMMKKCPIT